jgi:hypothetical protein
MIWEETIAGVTKAITLHGTSVSGFVRKLTMPFSVYYDFR